MRQRMIAVICLLPLGFPVFAQTPSDAPRAGMSKAWAELLAAEKAKRAEVAAKPEAQPTGRVLGVAPGGGATG